MLIHFWTVYKYLMEIDPKPWLFRGSAVGNRIFCSGLSKECEKDSCCVTRGSVVLAMKVRLVLGSEV